MNNILIALGVILFIVLLYHIIYRHELKYAYALIKRGLFVMPNRIESVHKTSLTVDDLAYAITTIKRDRLDVKNRHLIAFSALGGDVKQFLAEYKRLKALKLKDLTPFILFDLHIAKGDLTEFADVVVMARNGDVELNLKELIAVSFKPGDMRRCIKEMITAKNSGIVVTLSEITSFYMVGGDVEKFTYSMVRIKKMNLDITKNDLVALSNRGADIKDFVDAVVESIKAGVQIQVRKLIEQNLQGNASRQVLRMSVRAKEANLPVSIDSLVDHARMNGDVEKLINTLIRAQEQGITTSFAELERFFQQQGDVDKFFTALKMAKKEKLSITNAKLFEIHALKIDILDFVKAAKDASALGITVDEIEADFMQHRNVNEVLSSIEYAKGMGIELSYRAGMLFDRNGHNLREVISQALNPRVYQMKAVKAVAQDGVELVFTANALARIKLDQFFRGSREDVLSDRVNEAIIKEVESYDTHRQVIQNLNIVAQRVLKRILGEEEPIDNFMKDKFTIEEELKISNEKQKQLNSSSALEVFDINIPLVETSRDTLADLKRFRAKTEALARKSIAETEIIEAEAEIKKSMAQGFREGNMVNMNEYHKKQMMEDRIVFRELHTHRNEEEDQ